MKLKTILISLIIIATVVIPAIATSQDITGSVTIVECTVGMTLGSTSLNFGSLIKGGTSDIQEISLNISGTGTPCISYIPVNIRGTNWAAGAYTMPVGQTKYAYNDVPSIVLTTSDVLVGNLGNSILPIKFRLDVPSDQVAGIYSQTITITGTY